MTSGPDLPQLPLPPLHQSLDGYLAAVRPLLDAAQHRRAAAVVAEFATTDGPACQAELRRFDEQEHAAGRSWLSRAWLSSYLTSRDPLPLSTNVGFRIRLESASVGVERAADVLHRIASVHLASLRGEIAAECSPRGAPIDMRQWQVLAGGMRHPHPAEDVVIDGRSGAAAREIGVLWRGRCLMMPISDDAGQPLSRPGLAGALHRIRTHPLTDDDTFTHVSYLGSDTAAAHLGALLEHPRNAQVYDRLVHAVFLVTLTDSEANDEQHQERMAFEPGHAWASKPFSYQISLVDDFVGVHVEHSVVDGATLRSMVSAMQAAPPPDDQPDAPPIALEPLAWSMPDALRDELARNLVSYRRQADAHRARIVQVSAPVPPDLPFSVSHDAVQQLIFLFAQRSTYGCVRSTYEAVDMREYVAGRTECLRPVTMDALALIDALLDGTATPTLLHAALATHKRRVIACKQGQGFDRHLQGLQHVAQRMGLTPALFADASYDALMTDFLSTTSVGDARQIIRITFAPTSVGGIGVNYTVTDGGYEFCLTYDAEQTERIDAFAEALEAGASAIGRLLVRAVGV